MGKRAPVRVTNVAILPKDGTVDDAIEWARATLHYKDADEGHHKLYGEDDHALYMPRGAWSQCPHRPDEVDYQTSVYPASMPKPLRELYPHQNKPVSKMVKVGSGILQAPTGSGKTTMLLCIASALQQRTLILVHTRDLLAQWRSACEEVLGFTPGLIGNGKWDEHPLLTVAMIQTLTTYQQLPPDWLETWGCVMQDEAHRCPAVSFSHVISQMTAEFVYGATATPTRRDGHHPLMEAIIGPVRVRVGEEGLIKAGKLLRPRVRMVPTNFSSADGIRMAKAAETFQRRALYGRIVAELAEDEQRARLIASNIVKHKAGHQLVLSERIAHLYLIEREIHSKDPSVSTFVLTGQHSAQEREHVLQLMRNGDLDVLLATQLADEGLDIVNLDTLHLTFPRGGKSVEKLQQQLGRIMRTAKGKKGCLVLDYVDHNVPVLRNQAKARHRWYVNVKQCKMSGWEPGGGSASLESRIKRLKERSQLSNPKTIRED